VHRDLIHRMGTVIALVTVLSMACGDSSRIRLDHPAGTPLRTILVDATGQAPHLYVVVHDARFMDVPCTEPVAGAFQASRLFDVIDRACRLDHRLQRFEPGSPRITVRIFRVSETIAGPYAVVHRGSVKIVQK
jgi:hypothetical protein